MLRKNLSLLPAVFVLTLLVLLIGIVPVRASPTMPVVPPISGAHGPAAPVHTVPASTCSSWTQVASPNPSRLNFLYSVTGTATDAWAVGYSGNGFSQSTLTEHWNGSQWSVVLSPGSGFLHGVAMVSSNDVWAVAPSTASPAMPKMHGRLVADPPPTWQRIPH